MPRRGDHRQVVLGLAASAFGLGAGFALLADFWAIGAAAGAIWWATGVEARGMSLEALAARPDPARGG